MNELKNCPFCCSEKCQTRDGASGKHDYVECPDCGAYIESPSEFVTAVELWNSRPSPWVSVEERLPEPNNLVLAFFGNHDGDIEVVRWSGEYWTRKAWPLGFYPTHWMLLPTPPEGE